ncbi:MAG TPA: hypothetical protein VF849_01415 [Blattabacteriaceae bacterium]
MKSEIIIRACEITELHYKNINLPQFAHAFKIFRKAIIVLEKEDAIKEEQIHNEALEGSQG